MKILYVTARWDPKDPDSGSGVNFHAYHVLKEHADDIQIAGPFQSKLSLFERGIRKIAHLITPKRFIKFYPSYIRRSNTTVEKMMHEFKPDIIFSKASIPLINVNLTAPLIYMCDSSVRWVKKEWPHFTKVGFWIMERWEKKVIDKATHIITFSHANKEYLIHEYQKPEKQVTVHPIPSSLPHGRSGYHQKPFGDGEKLQLILVGKTFYGKGTDIAVETVHRLNKAGIPTKLRIIGQDGPDTKIVRYMGLYSTKDPEELTQYIANYQWAHFLIFPSRFDAAGIVPSEAAGFGVPTITNNSGGLATTVKDGVSGVVLPEGSPASNYAACIQYYWENPSEYHNLCQTTYERYQRELNWDVLGDRLIAIIQTILNKQQT